MNWFLTCTQKFFAPPIWLMGRIFLGLEIRGAENVKNSKGPLIIIANHQSSWDPFLLGSTLVFYAGICPVHFMAKDSLFRNIFSASLLRLWGAFPACRGQGREKALEIPKKILRSNGFVAIFPEGKRMRDDLGIIRPGAALLARDTGVGLLPAALIDTKKIILVLGRPFFIDSSLPLESAQQKIYVKIKSLYHENASDIIS